VSYRGSGARVRIAFAIFAAGWGASQFSPMLIVYRHELALGAGAVAGLFLVYALTLIPGLLLGGPASDRFGRRPVVVPFVALSPLATLLLVLGPRSLALICAGRALAGLCSGVVFGSATAWVQELSRGTGHRARRSALALTAGFGLGPVTAAVLAQWAPDPMLLPYLPHLVTGSAAAVTAWPAPEGTRHPVAPHAPGRHQRERNPTAQGSSQARDWPPAAARTARFWLAVAPASPMVSGSMSPAIVVLPEEITSARTLSAGFAGLITALAFAAGVAVQPIARRVSNPLAGDVAGLCCGGGRRGARRRRGGRHRSCPGRWLGGSSRPGLRAVPGVRAAAGRTDGPAGRARRGSRLLLRAGLPGFRGTVPS